MHFHGSKKNSMDVLKASMEDLLLPWKYLVLPWKYVESCTVGGSGSFHQIKPLPSN